MPITIACQHCDWKGRVKDDLAGKKGKCPTCGELVPIPKKGAPPPVPAGKSAVDDEPDVVDDADIVDDEPRPAPKRSTPARRDDDDEDDRPRKARRRDDDEEEDRPARSRRRDDDEEEDDRPRKARRRDEDERPARARRRDEDEDERPAKSRRRDDDDDEDRPRKRRPVEDDDEEDRPRKKRRGGPKRRSGGGRTISSKKIGQLVASVLFLLLGIGLVALWYMADNPRRFPIWGIVLIVSSLIGIGQAAVNPYEDD